MTGANSSIGLAVARGFAASSANLAILADRQEMYDAGETLNAETGRDVTVPYCGITDREMVSRTLSPLTCIDVLINNAGLGLTTPIEERGTEGEETFRRIIDINVMGIYYVTLDALKVMPVDSSMVFTASIWAKTAVAGFGACCASKHTIPGFMRLLAQELGPRGINVNAVCPGFIRIDAFGYGGGGPKQPIGAGRHGRVARQSGPAGVAGTWRCYGLVSAPNFVRSGACLRSIDPFNPLHRLFPSCLRTRSPQYSFDNASEDQASVNSADVTRCPLGS